MRDLDRAEKHRRKALNSELIMLQRMEDSLRDRRRGSGKEIKKCRRAHNGIKRRLSEDSKETEGKQRRSEKVKNSGEGTAETEEREH